MVLPNWLDTTVNKEMEENVEVKLFRLQLKGLVRSFYIIIHMLICCHFVKLNNFRAYVALKSYLSVFRSCLTSLWPLFASLCRYKDATKTAFKSSTRLECMMQDYPKTLPPSVRVGFTVSRRYQYCFWLLILLQCCIYCQVIQVRGSRFFLQWFRWWMLGLLMHLWKTTQKMLLRYDEQFFALK